MRTQRKFLVLAVLAWTLTLAAALAGCLPADQRSTGTAETSATLPPGETSALPQPEVYITPVRPSPTPAPSPETTAQEYLAAWQRDDYAAMYGLLTLESQQTISQEDFTRRYLDVMENMTVLPGRLDFQMGAASQDASAGTARLEYSVIFHTRLFGDIARQNQLGLASQAGGWRVVWEPGTVLPELAAGGKLVLLNDIPARGNIYDRNGNLIVGVADANAIGLNPAFINANAEETMLNSLENITGWPAEYISTLYEDSAGVDTYIPLTDRPATTGLGSISGYDAIDIYSFSGRYYFLREAGSQSIGYISSVQPEEVSAYKRRGYQWTERVARGGIELWAEPWLGGTRGGTLYLYDANNQPLSVLAATQKQPAYDVYTTLDRDLQAAAQRALFGLSGAVIVLEKNTGRVLAMASSPGFNPNLFEPTNYNAIFDSPFFTPNSPLFNRASQGQRPLGSVFKIITLAAALESGRFTKESTYECGHAFTELNGVTLYDWTYWDEIDPSGLLTLPEGLMRSCNPWFWHIGVDLYNAGLANKITEMAQGFGLGSPTGILQVSENAGQVPVPNELLAATNLAIGQGDLLVTPLQVVRFVAAVGNGGTLYLPQMVERVQSPEGEVVFTLNPQAMGTLPVSPETLQTIQQAMTAVVENRRGTAYRILGNFGYPIAGKTSTSETGVFDPDAWFVTYSSANLPNKPDIAVVAMIEQVGEGADYAAPVVRRVLEVYFYGSVRTKYPWEIRIGLPEFILPEETPTPTPESLPEPAPQSTPTPESVLQPTLEITPTP